MKRSWQNLVLIAATVLAGAFCSTARADGKGGISRGMSSARSMGGSFSGSGGTSMSRGVAPRVVGGSQGSFHGQNLSQGLKHAQVKPAGQVRPLPGNFNSSQLGQKVAGKAGGSKVSGPKLDGVKVGGQNSGGKNLGSHLLDKAKLNPELSKKIGPALGGDLKQKLGGDLAGKLGPVLGGSGKSPIGLNPNLGHKLTPAIINCKPIVNPCHNPCNKWCGPCWWWSPWYCNPVSTGCYYPPVYTYPDPIIIPVTTTVVTSSTVVPATATEPVTATEGEPTATETITPAALVSESADGKPVQIPVGATITLQGKELGSDAGQVVVQIDKLSMPTQMNEWKAEAAVVTLPMLGLAEPTKAQLWMVKADGAVAANIAVELIPAKPPTEAVAATTGEVK